MKNRNGKKTTAREIANEILSDAIDSMLQRYGSVDEHLKNLNDIEHDKVWAQVKKVARKALKGTGFTNIYCEDVREN